MIGGGANSLGTWDGGRRAKPGGLSVSVGLLAFEEGGLACRRSFPFVPTFGLLFVLCGRRGVFFSVLLTWSPAA